ncbi:glycoside hydrolase family 9 protein [Ruminococcus sp.]|uniref:glycoside hydrolase family 9 protein n=1 Tax=Ruminococcus sp. TaxID=41978 RepID=UPI003F04FD22
MKSKAKRLAALLTTGAVCGTIAAAPKSALPQGQTASAANTYNYAEAMQKSLFFYQAQQSGPLADWNEVPWRADCMLNDYVTGGWFDAGDHIKFALTNAYSSAMLAWGILEYPQGLKDAGLYESYLRNLQFSLDFLVGCDLGDEVVYQIGEIGFDHKWWGSAEVYMRKYELMQGETERPYYTTKDSNVTGEMAAALAAGYLVFKDSDPALAKTYLEHAENCFKIADTTRDHKNTPASDSMYPSSHFYDELFWAANWMYKATGDQKYLDLCESDYIPNLGKEDQSTEMKYTWGMCWDDVQQGGTLLYALNTGDATWKEQFRKHLEYWTTGYGGKQIKYTPDGLAWLFNWGSLRHATTTAFMAYVAADQLFSGTDDAKKYTDFADSQMNYCFGDNANNFSYVIGMGDSYPKAWHHRTSSGVWDDQWTMLGEEKEYAHVLYGALVGGPGQDGSFTDKVNSYEYTEVAIDYNAGYTAALCAMIQKYGGEPLANFPPEETPKWDEFFIEAAVNQSGDSYTEVKVLATNHSAWPARLIKNLSYRYYFDISEILAAGLTVDDISVRIGYDEHSSTQISQPIQYEGNVYYVEITYPDGTVICPSGQSEHQAELQFRISVPDASKCWDATNDYSFEGLGKSGNECVKTERITMYDSGVLIYGVEPDGTTPADNPVVTTTTSGDEVLLGDADCNGIVNVQDYVLIKQFMVKKAELTAKGGVNADMNQDRALTVSDCVLLARKLLS